MSLVLADMLIRLNKTQVILFNKFTILSCINMLPSYDMCKPRPVAARHV